MDHVDILNFHMIKVIQISVYRIFNNDFDSSRNSHYTIDETVNNGSVPNTNVQIVIGMMWHIFKFAKITL